MIHKSDNTPGQMEATASTAKGRKSKAQIYEESIAEITWGGLHFLARVKFPIPDISTAIYIDNIA